VILQNEAKKCFVFSSYCSRSSGDGALVDRPDKRPQGLLFEASGMNYTPPSRRSRAFTGV
jgi:hypothetical protein